MLPEPEASMLPEHIQVELLCPAHDGDWEALQALHGPILLKQQQ
jgi:hypothetical protein